MALPVEAKQTLQKHVPTTSTMYGQGYTTHVSLKLPREAGS